MKHVHGRRNSWINEFDNLMGINMSYCERIPAVVKLFLNVQQHYGLNIEKVLDVGCGNGRIGLHLAKLGYHVTGIDFVPSALAHFRDSAKRMGLESNVRLFECDITGTWNIPAASMDALFAVTVIENLITEQNITNFIRECTKSLRRGGVLVLEWYSPLDGYYGILPDAGDSLDSNIVLDAKNNIRFRLFTFKEIQQRFKKEFTVLDNKTMHFKSTKYGVTYTRESEIVILGRET